MLAPSYRNTYITTINMFKEQVENMGNMHEHMGDSAGRWK